MIGDRFNGEEGGNGNDSDMSDDDDDDDDEESDEGDRISIYSNSDDEEEEEDDDDDDDDDDDSDSGVTINFSNGDGFDSNSLQNKLKKALSRAVSSYTQYLQFTYMHTMIYTYHSSIPLTLLYTPTIY